MNPSKGIHAPASEVGSDGPSVSWNNIVKVIKTRESLETSVRGKIHLHH